MMRNGLIGLMALALLPLSGCAGGMSLPYAHRIENTVLMRTLGVDLGRDGGVGVSASSGGRSGAGDSPAQAAVALSAQGDTISAACQKLQTFGADFIFFGDVEQFLIGEGQAGEGLDQVLAHVARDPELRLEAQVWAVRGASAADVVFSGGEEGVPDRLEALRADEELTGSALSRTAREVLVDLSRNGCTLLPALTLTPARPGDGSEGERTISAAGYGVFREGSLAGWAEGAAARGIGLLLNRGGGVLELPVSGGTVAALRLTGVRTDCLPQFEGDRLSGLKIKCKVEAQLSELRGDAAILSRETLERLERELKSWTETALREALHLSQSLEADFLGLEYRAALAAPWRKAALEEQWPRRFGDLPVHVEGEVTVARF